MRERSEPRWPCPRWVPVPRRAGPRRARAEMLPRSGVHQRHRYAQRTRTSTSKPANASAAPTQLPDTGISSVMTGRGNGRCAASTVVRGGTRPNNAGVVGLAPGLRRRHPPCVFAGPFGSVFAGRVQAVFGGVFAGRPLPEPQEAFTDSSARQVEGGAGMKSRAVRKQRKRARPRARARARARTYLQIEAAAGSQMKRCHEQPSFDGSPHRCHFAVEGRHSYPRKGAPVVARLGHPPGWCPGPARYRRGSRYYRISKAYSLLLGPPKAPNRLL